MNRALLLIISLFGGEIEIMKKAMYMLLIIFVIVMIPLSGFADEKDSSLRSEAITFITDHMSAAGDIDRIYVKNKTVTFSFKPTVLASNGQIIYERKNNGDIVLTVSDDTCTNEVLYTDSGVYIDGIRNSVLSGDYDNDNHSPTRGYVTSYSTTKSSLSTGTYSRISTSNGNLIFDYTIATLANQIISQVISATTGFPSWIVDLVTPSFKTLAINYRPTATTGTYTKSTYADNNNSSYGGLYYFYYHIMTYAVSSNHYTNQIVYQMDTLV